MTRLGIISDEISSDFERSCALARSWGLEHVELRTLWGKNLLELTEADIQAGRQILHEHELDVTALASPIFKAPLDGRARVVTADFALAGAESSSAQLALLERACHLCRTFDTRMLRVFTFWREAWTKEVVEAISSRLIDAAEVAEHHDVTLVVENEPVCNVRQGWELGALFTALDARAPAGLRDHLSILWDPGNARYAGEEYPYPEGYRHLDPSQIGHVHLKDVAFGEDGKPYSVPLGSGRVDVVGQLRQLEQDGYKGYLVLEPHYRPPKLSQEEAAEVAVRAAQQLLAQSIPGGAHD